MEDLETRVSNRLGESVSTVIKRNADSGKTLMSTANTLDVSVSTTARWAKKHSIKFKRKNPFANWRI